MKKISTRINILIFVFINLILLVVMPEQTISLPVKYQWGTTLESIKKSHQSRGAVTLFSPREKPGYRNKILGFILNIDETFAEKIVILRTGSDPRIDYLFVNNRLYTILEDYGTIHETRVQGILDNLAGLYGTPHLQQDSNFYIYSYKNDTTNVLLYVLKQSAAVNRCKLYFYTKKLFSSLIMD